MSPLLKHSDMAHDGKWITQLTCHALTNHTCLYSPAAEHHCRLAGTHCAYPRWPGWVDLGDCLYTVIDFPAPGVEPRTQVTHPSTNRARRRLTSLIETNALTTMPNPTHTLTHSAGCWEWRRCSIMHNRLSAVLLPNIIENFKTQYW